MEIELKYKLNKDIDIETFFDIDLIKPFICGKISTKDMYALYYDTPSLAITKNKGAIRVRKEGHEYVKTLKWGGYQCKGLHKRYEENVNTSKLPIVTDSKSLISGFKKNDVNKEILAFIENLEDLSPMIIMDFTRKEVDLKVGLSIATLSVDFGKIKGNSKETNIREVEIELKEGFEKDILEFGNILSHKLGLKPEEKSKLERGFSLFSS